MDKRAKELLTWATSQSSSTDTDAGVDPPVAPSRKLDPAIIDAILGPDDATLMVESMKAVMDTSLSLDDRFFPYPRCPPVSSSIPVSLLLIVV